MTKPFIRKIIPFGLLLLLLLFTEGPLLAQEVADSARVEEELTFDQKVDQLRDNGDAVVVKPFERELFVLPRKANGKLPVKEAKAVEQAIRDVVDRDFFYEEHFLVEQDTLGFYLSYKDITVLRQNDWLEHGSQVATAEYYKAIISSEIRDEQPALRWEKFIHTAIYLAIYLIILFVYRLVKRRIFRVLRNNEEKLKYWSGKLKIKNFSLIDEDKLESSLFGLVNVIYWFLVLLATYLLVPAILNEFYLTRDVAATLWGYIMDPVKTFVRTSVAFIPNFIKIVVSIVIFRYLTRLVTLFFEQIRKGNIHLAGFYPDWAMTTAKLIRIVLYAFLFTFIWPLLPGSDSEIFKGISVFIGLLISLGSSSVISNMLSGLVITYMRPFKIGDRVTIDQITGEVREKTLLVTRIRTFKNEIVTVPNSKILNGHSINYSTAAEDGELILHTEVTIGYDVDWRVVHRLLLDAAKKTNGVVSKMGKEPFVLQKSLSDFYVAYELNAFTAQADKLAPLYSELHAHILDNFNKEQIEIMSPHYRANRSGEDVAIPKDRPPDTSEKDEKANGGDAADLHDKINKRMEDKGKGNLGKIDN